MVGSWGIADWIGAETVLVVPGATRVAWDPSRPVIPYGKVWKNAVDSLRKLIPAAEKHKVSIGIENVWNRFLISPMEWKFFLDQFDSPYIGMYFDIGNACLNCRPQDFPELLGSRIKAVHVKNFEETDSAEGALKQLSKEKVGLLGAEVLMDITPQLGKIADDLPQLVAAYKGVSIEEANKLDAAEVINEIINDDGVTSFFKRALRKKAEQGA